jgi:phage tail-like protein
MPAHDANNATWRMLRYPLDFESQGTSGPHDPLRPLLDDSLVFDERRGLELRPLPLAEEVQPVPGIAIDVNGEVYRSAKRPARIDVTRCDGSVEPLVCEKHVFAAPRGLALDRRGLLYVADIRARRVVAIQPDDGSVRGVLGKGRFVEPVDVAAAPSGHIFVADRGGLGPDGQRRAGVIWVYTAGFRFERTFVPQSLTGLPETPRPIAVMVDEDGTILVADASHPRLLRFTPAGYPLGEVDLLSAAANVPAPRAASVFSFLKGACCPPRPPHDGGEGLAGIHRALRLAALVLGRKFETEGVFLSASLDAGSPGIQWHRVEVEAELPEGTRLTIETAAAEDPALLDPSTAPAGIWQAPRNARGEIIPVTREVPDQLVQSPPGRYLRLRVRLSGNGTATPKLRSIRILYPRVSYLDLLPAVYRRDPEGSLFLERFLALFEGILTAVEDRYEEFSRELNPDAAPREVIDWLACLIDLAFDPSWPLERRRELVASAMDLYRRRGTVEGLARYVEIYTGIRPVIMETFLKRPAEPPFLGRTGSVLGCALGLSACRPETPPQELLYRDFAHRFTVVVYLPDGCDDETVRPVVNRIVETNRPAHTLHSICMIGPDVRLEIQSTVGVDFMLGDRGAPGAPLGGCEGRVASAPPALGVDSVLSERRPQYVRRLDI